MILLRQDLLLNFNILLLFFLISACGVKSHPVAPKETELPSYVDKFLNSKDINKEDKKKKSETTSGS